MGKALVSCKLDYCNSFHKLIKTEDTKRDVYSFTDAMIYAYSKLLLRGIFVQAVDVKVGLA